MSSNKQATDQLVHYYEEGWLFGLRIRVFIIFFNKHTTLFISNETWHHQLFKSNVIDKKLHEREHLKLIKKRSMFRKLLNGDCVQK